MVDGAQAFGLVLIAVGALLFIFELLHPGVFVVVPGTVVVVAGIFYLTAPSVLTESVYGPAALGIVAVLATALSVLYYQRIGANHPPMVTMPATLAGKEGVVTAPVIPDSLRGKVRIDSEIWSARSKVPIPAGTRVRVLGGEGVAVDVVPLGQEPRAS